MYIYNIIYAYYNYDSLSLSCLSMYKHDIYICTYKLLCYIADSIADDMLTIIRPTLLRMILPTPLHMMLPIIYYVLSGMLPMMLPIMLPVVRQRERRLLALRDGEAFGAELPPQLRPETPASHRPRFPTVLRQLIDDQ